MYHVLDMILLIYLFHIWISLFLFLLFVRYDGDLLDDERILEWLTSQDVFEVKAGMETFH